MAAHTNGTVPLRRGLIATAVLTLAGSPAARGQDALASAELESEMMPELPTHPRGERQRVSLPKAPDPTEPPQEPLPERDWFGGKPWWTWDSATGDWGDARRALEDAGITLGATYTFDWTSVWHGGVNNVASTRSLFDVTMSVDAEKLLGITGGSFFFDFYSINGRGQGDVGDIQSFDNIAIDTNVDQIAEVWYEQKLFGDVLRVKAGKVDANSEFGFPVTAGDFLHSSAAYSPTAGSVLPTYPNPAMGVNVFVYPTDWLHISAAVYDGAGGDGIMTGGRGPATFFSDDKSSDWFLISEIGTNWASLIGNCAEHNLKGRAAIGLWHHTGDFERFDGGREGDGTTGFYALIEQRLLPRSSDVTTAEEDSKGLWLFAQYGYADGALFEIETHIGAGLVLHGTFAGREDDSTGAYLSWADMSDDRDAGFTNDETALEVYYKFQATPFLSIRPDLQVIWNPSGDSDIETAVVGGVRLEVAF